MSYPTSRPDAASATVDTARDLLESDAESYESHASPNGSSPWTLAFWVFACLGSIVALVAQPEFDPTCALRAGLAIVLITTYVSDSESLWAYMNAMCCPASACTSRFVAWADIGFSRVRWIQVVGESAICITTILVVRHEIPIAATVYALYWFAGRGIYNIVLLVINAIEPVAAGIFHAHPASEEDTVRRKYLPSRLARSILVFATAGTIGLPTLSAHGYHLQSVVAGTLAAAAAFLIRHIAQRHTFNLRTYQMRHALRRLRAGQMSPSAAVEFANRIHGQPASELLQGCLASLTEDIAAIDALWDTPLTRHERLRGARPRVAQIQVELIRLKGLLRAIKSNAPSLLATRMPAIEHAQRDSARVSASVTRLTCRLEPARAMA